MNTNELKLQGISKNLKYVFTNRGMYDFLDDKVYNYDLNTLYSKGIDMLKETSELEFKAGIKTLKEYSSESRRMLYVLTETFQMENSVTIIKEWENKFGNKLLLINESVDKLLIEQRINDSWDSLKVILEYWGEDFVNWGKKKIKSNINYVGDQFKQIRDKGIIDWSSEKVKKVWSYVKQKAMDAWKCLSNNFVECLMEGLRSAVLSPVGVTVEVVLAVTGVGAPAVMIVYGLLLLWDIYLMISNYEKFEWWNLLLDIIGILTAGVAVPGVRALMMASKKIFAGAKSIAEVVNVSIAKGGKLGAFVSSLATKINNKLPDIIKTLTDSANWIYKNFGIKFLVNYINRAKDVLVNLKSSIAVALGMSAAPSLGRKLVSKLGSEHAQQGAFNTYASYKSDKEQEKIDKEQEKMNKQQDDLMTQIGSKGDINIDNLSDEDIAQLGIF